MKNTILRLLERNVEFLVLGLVAVVFAVYVAMQFVGDPNAGTMGPKGPERSTISPANVNSTLEDHATYLKKQLEKTRETDGMQGLEKPEPPDLLERYRLLAGERVVPSGYEVFAVGPRGPVDGEGGEVTEEVSEVHVPPIPAPEQILVYQSFDTMAESVVQAHESLSGRFKSAPFDVSWLTVAAEFDIDEVLSRFRSKGVDGQRAMSERWFNGRVDVLDVVVERREVRADGTSTEPELIKLLPGQVSFRERIEGEVSAGQRDGILDDLRGGMSQQMVVQPEFLPTMYGLWEDPGEAASELARGGEEDPRERLIRLIERRREVQAELDRASGAPGGGPGGIGGGGGMGGPGGGGGMGGPGGGGMGGPGGGGMGGPGGGGMGGPGGMGGGPGGVPGGGGGDHERLVKRLQKQIRRLSNDIKRLARTLGWTEEDIEAYEPEKPAESAGFELKGTLQIWAHDLEVEPGKTYQYRMSAVVYNPLFAKSLSLAESQRPLASDVSLASLPGQWSAPYRVRRPTRTYVLRATAAGQGRGIVGSLGLGLAQVEVYRFRNGKWHRSKQSVQPGDEVGVVEGDDADGTAMDFATGWYVVDIVADPLATDGHAASGRGALVLFGQAGVDGLVDSRAPLVDRAAIKPWIESESEGGSSGG